MLGLRVQHLKGAPHLKMHLLVLIYLPEVVLVAGKLPWGNGEWGALKFASGLARA